MWRLICHNSTLIDVLAISISLTTISGETENDKGRWWEICNVNRKIIPWQEQIPGVGFCVYVMVRNYALDSFQNVVGDNLRIYY